MARLLAPKLVLALAALVACAACASLPGGRNGSTLIGRGPASSPQEEEPQIQPDQPDHTNAAYTVPTALVQLETSGQWNRLGTGGHAVQTPTSVRVGLASWCEARFDTSGVVATDIDGVSTTQFSGAAVGGKFRLWAAPLGLVLTTMPEVTLPYGRGGDGTDFLLSFMTGRDYAGRLHTDGEYAIAWLSTDGERFTQQMLSLSTNLSVTNNWQPYAEVYWFSHSAPASPRFVGFDAGATYSVNQRAAVDAAIDMSLTDASVRPALMFGVSIILGEAVGHRGVAARMREAQRRGDR